MNNKNNDYFIELSLGTINTATLNDELNKPLIDYDNNYKCRVNFNYYVYNRLITLMNLFFVCTCLLYISINTEGVSKIIGYIVAGLYSILSISHLYFIHKVSQNKSKWYSSIIKVYAWILPCITIGSLIGLLWYKNKLGETKYFKSWNNVEKYSLVTFSLPILSGILLMTYKLKQYILK